MKILVTYTCVTNGQRTEDLATRFVATQLIYPPGHSYDLVVGCNGGKLDHYTSAIFLPLNGVRFFPRSNAGWDIGLYLEIAKGLAANYDLLVCFGESVYFHAPNWLARLVACYERYGEGMYGFFSSYAVRAHLNTSAFAAPPQLIASYPIPVRTRRDRYEFEHGTRSLWRMLAGRGIPSWLVTWDGCWGPHEWRKPTNILWRGNQMNCLVRCNHWDGYAAIPAITQAKWRQTCDQPYR